MRAQQLWQDLDTNKFYKIDAVLGKQKKVSPIGENVKQYYQSVSGSASFMKRLEHGQLQRDSQVVPKVPSNMQY